MFIDFKIKPTGFDKYFKYSSHILPLHTCIFQTGNDLVNNFWAWVLLAR